MRYLSLVSLVFLLNLSTSVSAEEQTQWHYSLGIHDFVVDEENSHTLGANMSLLIAHRTASNIQLLASLDVFLDVDVDDLDPDHIPIWFKSDYAAIGELYRFNPEFFFGWQVDLQGKRNTVSSVEKQLKLFPALTANYQDQRMQAQLKAGAGYYFMEIDDDVPRTRGYDRGDFGNDGLAYTAMGSFGVDITPQLHMSAAAQTWHDGDAWLEDQYRFDLTYQTNFWAEHSQWVLSVEHTQYNLDHYAKVDVNSPEYLPILPWDNDTLVRLSLIVPW
ncbi:hypothetical protein [Shewanella sp. CG12_big_fil_rev_8_21_14_0_65_47_15]|uniref:hypothetical protein n=1 Tax=Shewanella sp. CG12_big_fil_rev_8_21_14_0_65_47_15 TaxID=1975537 RepID=UPI000CAECACF|nr:hypothetical protein [Shewanella sp. CG12_big_fil_rev_8_21_14_0_65_47_15]PIW61944.1 MAG: hypothetical protein COW15_05000 [Shewanella sp. CG12_big_fil_rev_8_21_14_0_65_47_15]